MSEQSGPVRLSNRLWRWEILRNAVGSPYLYRFTLMKWPGEGSLYLHRFVGDDWSRDPHDHPKSFTSIGLWGSYIEIRYLRDPDDFDQLIPGERWQRFDAPWIRRFPAEHVHRIILPASQRSCWTLVVTGQAIREWGFFPRRCWMSYAHYLDRVRSGKIRP